MEKVVLKRERDNLPQIGWYDSKHRHIILFIDTEGKPHVLLIKDPLSKTSDKEENRARAEYLTHELESEVDEKCVRITPCGFIGESGAHYMLSYPNDVIGEDEDDYGDIEFEAVGEPMFSCRKKALKFEYDHSSWSRSSKNVFCKYRGLETEKEILSCDGVKDCIVLPRGRNEMTIVTLFDDGTLCTKSLTNAEKDMIGKAARPVFRTGSSNQKIAVDFGDKSAYDNRDIPRDADNTHIISIHRISDEDAVPCVVAASESGKCFVIGDAPEPFEDMLRSNASTIVATNGEGFNACICLGITSEGTLSLTTSLDLDDTHDSAADVAKQIKGSKNIADIACIRTEVESSPVNLFAAVDCEGKISLFSDKEYIQKYAGMIPREFQLVKYVYD